jgi:hypothetical protein
MDEGQRCGVQKETLVVKTLVTAMSVAKVVHHRVADRREVDTNLVRSTRLQT